ncbi:hypothetical protein GGTG_06747 [Gaeumannomyces tritici R3-111a-1]|uniref:Infection structure specific protein n=1 Tax=Gaeumannomyces tritici (strain R3-111a-1) TaxID=644352 RepID=J3NZQ0_GAET3|nr:hypothetical protein GGTG_06747 [Gaeumannomyces tritici R3-111a-1]EJT76833.1 hypothetical protein GGTG_06747 [Gaeumannomyces tritici R3-111a-1]
MHPTIIITALALAAAPVLGQTTTTPPPTTTPPAGADTTACLSIFYSLATQQPNDHPAVESWYSEQQASRSSALAATPSLSSECMPQGFVVPTSLYAAESSARAAQESWGSAHAADISSYLSRCSDFARAQQTSALAMLSSRVLSRQSCQSKTATRSRSGSSLVTSTTATSSTTGSSTASGTGAAQSGTSRSGAGRVVGTGVVGVAAAAVFVGLAGWM